VETSTVLDISTTTIVDPPTTTTATVNNKSYEFQSNFSRNNDSVFVSLHSNASDVSVSINNTFSSSKYDRYPCEILFNEYSMYLNMTKTTILIHFNGTFTRDLATQLGDRFLDMVDLLLTVRSIENQNNTIETVWYVFFSLLLIINCLQKQTSLEIVWSVLLLQVMHSLIGFRQSEGMLIRALRRTILENYLDICDQNVKSSSSFISSIITKSISKVYPFDRIILFIFFINHQIASYG
jgi:hypothetical protein